MSIVLRYAASVCTESICVKYVSPEKVEKSRSWLGRCLGGSETYIEEKCPEGSDPE
jgi:hypothetical protein